MYVSSFYVYSTAMLIHYLPSVEFDRIVRMKRGLRYSFTVMSLCHLVPFGLKSLSIQCHIKVITKSLCPWFHPTYSPATVSKKASYFFLTCTSHDHFRGPPPHSTIAAATTSIPLFPKSRRNQQEVDKYWEVAIAYADERRNHKVCSHRRYGLDNRSRSFDRIGIGI